MRLAKDTRMAEQGFVAADTAAALLGVGKPRAYAIGTSGRIETRPLGGAKYFSKASIDQYLRELEVPPIGSRWPRLWSAPAIRALPSTSARKHAISRCASSPVACML